MNIQTVVVNEGGPASVIVLTPADQQADGHQAQLPIRIGAVEAAAISMAVEGGHRRPLTHDLLASTISSLGASLDSVIITNVRGTTFYARLALTTEDGRHVTVDARPSDAIALAVKMRRPILANERVLDVASMPDFKEVERDEQRHELSAFHDFVEGLSPEDFSSE